MIQETGLFPRILRNASSDISFETMSDMGFEPMTRGLPANTWFPMLPTEGIVVWTISSSSTQWSDVHRVVSEDPKFGFLLIAQSFIFSHFGNESSQGVPAYR